MRNIIILLKGNINYDSRVQKEIDTLVSLNFKIKLVVWNHEPIFYMNEGVEIVDMNLSDYRVPRITFLTFFKMIKFWHLSSKIIKQGDYDYVHCNDLETLGVLFFLPKKYNHCVIYDAHELYPERFSIRYMIRYVFWNLVEKILIKRIKTIIVPEFHRAKYLKRKYKLEKIPAVIHNFPKYQTLIPRNIRHELNISDEKKIINYHGVIKANREIEAIIESLQYLSDEFILILFGYAYKDYLKNLKELVEKKCLKNRVIFYGAVTPQELLQTISQCDIGIALYQNKGINNYFCSPNKIFDYIMARVKVITNDYPSLQILKEYNFVRLISEVNPKSIAECAKDLAKQNFLTSDAIRKKFSWESCLEIFRNIYS